MCSCGPGPCENLPYQQTFLVPRFLLLLGGLPFLFCSVSGLEPALFKRPKLHFIAPGSRPHPPQQPSRTSLQQQPCGSACVAVHSRRLCARHPCLSRLVLTLTPPGSLSPPHDLSPVRPIHALPLARCECGRRGPGLAAVPGLGARSAMAGRLMLALPILLFLLLVGELLVACRS